MLPQMDSVHLFPSGDTKGTVANLPAAPKADSSLATSDLDNSVTSAEAEAQINVTAAN